VREGIKHPRHFAIEASGRWLLCANRDADTITLYRIDPASGGLTLSGQVSVPMPTRVLFVSP
jgi:6-phosphogluconolactonase